MRVSKEIKMEIERERDREKHTHTDTDRQTDTIAPAAEVPGLTTLRAGRPLPSCKPA